MLSSVSAPVLPGRDRLRIAVCIALITLLSWMYLVHLSRQMSVDNDKMIAEMGMAMDMPWSAADALLTFAMWVVMMAGMMSVSAAPMLMLFAGAAGARNQAGASVSVLLFGLGYLTVWTGFSAAATVAQWGLHHAAMLSPAMAASSPRLTGAVLITAGAYQLTPWKYACLRHCRSPLGFLMGHWRDGRLGAFNMGMSHGVYCLGCCWALMCVLFAVGVMNLVWVAVLTAFVLIEKIGPAGPLVARIAGVASIIAGIHSIVASV